METCYDSWKGECPHLDVNVACLLPQLGEEPSQVGGSVERQAGVRDGFVGVLLIACLVLRQRCTRSRRDPYLCRELGSVPH